MTNEGRWDDLKEKGHPNFLTEKVSDPFTSGPNCDILCALTRRKVIDEPPSEDKPLNGQLEL